jgi:hypothetical protein
MAHPIVTGIATGSKGLVYDTIGSRLNREAQEKLLTPPNELYNYYVQIQVHTVGIFLGQETLKAGFIKIKDLLDKIEKESGTAHSEIIAGIEDYHTKMLETLNAAFQKPTQISAENT